MSIYGDIYSFGILMLEILTGRKPTDEMFQDGLNLQKFVEISFHGNLLQILDPSLVPGEEEAEEGNGRTVDKCLASLFRIGLACLAESPKERMNMMDVKRELNIIREAFQAGKINRN